MPYGEQSLQLIGAGLVLGAYLLLQARYLRPHTPGYDLPNAVGATLLAVEAVRGEPQYGFLLLEGVWALAATISLGRWCWRRRSRATG